MLGILYLLAAFTTGLIIINIICKDFIHEVPICRSWLFVFPSSFFTGTLLMAWITYIAAWLFKSASEPLLFGNLISFLIAIGFIALTIFRDRKNKIKIEFDYSSADIIYVAFSLLFSCFIMFYTFHMKNNILHVGFSVFSDFGPHLSVIRSFSHGSNFPTEYPHFPSGNIRYHFMFQFLAGNLEFLNLRLDLAFNIISILSLTSFMMLLYCLAIIITGKKQAGIIAGFLFFFRSSLSFFTYISDQSSVKEMFHKIINTNTFIGNTPHEDWGLWNLNVYANQRHLAFSLGIMALTIIILLPLTDKMKKIMHNAREKLNRTHGISIDLIKFYLFSGDLWKCQSLKRAVFLGLILGFTAFWNGAVLIGTLAILMILAFIS